MSIQPDRAGRFHSLPPFKLDDSTFVRLKSSYLLYDLSTPSSGKVLTIIVGST